MIINKILKYTFQMVHLETRINQILQFHYYLWIKHLYKIKSNIFYIFLYINKSIIFF